jgi:CHAT domain-containing protein
MLLDEAIHLAETFQLVGYPRIIGSLWQLDDAHCSTVARRVYKELRTADGNIDTSKCALALHHAIRRLRDENGKDRRLENVLSWAPFVYLGA